MNRTLLIAAAAVLVAVSLTACSGSAKTAASSAASTTAAATSAGSTTSTSSSPTTAATSAQLAALVLQASEVPTGYTGTPYQASPTDAADHAAFAACAGVPDSAPHQVAEVHSADFAKSNASISSQATSFASQSDVDSDVSALTGSKAQSCFKSLLTAQVKSGLPAGTTVGDLQVAVTPGPRGGPANLVAFATAKVTVTRGGTSTPVYVDAAFLKGPQIEAEVDFQNVGAEFDSTIGQALVEKVAARVAG